MNSDISIIQDFAGSLGYQLPQTYCELIENYPEAMKKLGVDDYGGPADFELLSCPQDVVELNKRERQRWSSSDYAETEFPESYLLVGHDGCGDLYAIDLDDSEPCDVLQFEHDKPSWGKVAESLKQFVSVLLANDS